MATVCSTGINPKAKPYYYFDGYAHLASGLACGLSGLAAGMAIGIVGDAGVRWAGKTCLPTLAKVSIMAQGRQRRSFAYQSFIRSRPPTWPIGGATKRMNIFSAVHPMPSQSKGAGILAWDRSRPALTCATSSSRSSFDGVRCRVSHRLFVAAGPTLSSPSCSCL